MTNGRTGVRKGHTKQCSSFSNAQDAGFRWNQQKTKLKCQAKSKAALFILCECCKTDSNLKYHRGPFFFFFLRPPFPSVTHFSTHVPFFCVWPFCSPSYPSASASSTGPRFPNLPLLLRKHLTKAAGFAAVEGVTRLLHFMTASVHKQTNKQSLP